MNIAIIYHDADFDGKLSNEVCRYHLRKLHPDAAVHSYGWDYGRPVPVPYKLLGETPPTPLGVKDWYAYDTIYIVDLSVDALMEMPELRDKIVWIDHHKSAIEKWVQQGNKKYGFQFKGYRIDGVAACRLCWQWFVVEKNNPENHGLPTIEAYKNRTVSESTLIRLAGEYDIWDHRDPDAKALQFGLRSLSDRDFQILVESQFAGESNDYAGYGTTPLVAALANGYAIKSYCDKQNAEYAAAYAHTIKFRGLTMCALNIGQRGNSDLLLGGIKPEHDACFAWRYTGDAVMVSLYHIAGHEHHDLSKIAVRYGGGGHRGACGFRVNLSVLEQMLNGEHSAEFTNGDKP